MAVRDVAARNDLLFNRVQIIHNNAYVVEGSATVVFGGGRRWGFRWCIQGEIACLAAHVQ